ncbi:uncharacterized protein [Rutidosis leptorrhynchoides]|uniref:uncharacterized protein n=1 Tax=Rutidosis leptorrhynchoides TaxID=125765 RepID=UPI003A9933EA
MIDIIKTVSLSGSGTNKWKFSGDKSGWKRIAVRVELDQRGIDLDTLLCPICNDAVELVDHAIYSCKSAKDIWIGIFKWWNLPFPSGATIDELINGTCFTTSNTNKRKVWQAIMWVTCYMIWKNRNLKVFKNDSWATPKIICEIQVKSFEWIQNRSRKPASTWQQWLMGTNALDSTFDPG